MTKKIKDYIYEFINEFEGIKSLATTKGEKTLARAIFKALDYLNLEYIDQLDYESYKKIINYFKQNTKQKNSSINKHTQYIKTILRHYGYHKSTFLLGKSLKNDVINVRPYSEDELIEILRYYNSLNKSDNSHVYKGVVNLLYATGCRIGELLDIEIKNIDMKNRVILLTKTKTKKPRYVFFNKHHDQIIKDLIEKNGNKKYLFWNNLKNRRLSKEDIKNFNRKVSEILGININSRRFRKTMATDLAKVTSGDLKMIQIILGHSDIKMTQVYVEYSEQQAKKIYDEKSIELNIYKNQFQTLK